MTGEMVAIDPVTGIEPDGTEWSFHAAIAAAVGGTVQPFDQYQGPYVAVGADIRIGGGPYAVAPVGLGVCRLWVTEHDGAGAVYREDTDEMSGPIFTEEDAADAARALMRGGA